MPTLQQALDEALREAPYQAFSELIAAKLDAQGVRLSARERRQLAQQLRSGAPEKFRLWRWRWWETQDVTIEITDQDLERFQNDFSGFLQEDLPEFINVTAEELATRSMGTLKRRWAAERRTQDRELREFRKNLDRHWRSAIRLLRLFVTISRELGDVMVSSFRDVDDAGRQHLVDVQTRLHARACQVSDEIVCLLCAGFSDGAMARWRTLHEIAVVGLLVSEHGDTLAERYIAHDAVESWKAACEYQKCCRTLGYAQIGDSELRELERNYREVTTRYGPSFQTQYGWAADVVQKSRPTFADIERAAGVGYLRAHYRLASHQVHSNPKGTFFRLGLMDEVDVLLSGPSNFGLADPGQNTAVSLSQISVFLVMTAPTLDGIVAAKILAALTSEVCNAFFEAQSIFYEDPD